MMEGSGVVSGAGSVLVTNPKTYGSGLRITNTGFLYMNIKHANQTIGTLFHPPHAKELMK